MSEIKIAESSTQTIARTNLELAFRKPISIVELLDTKEAEPDLDLAGMEEVPLDNGKFRLTNKKLLVTYRTHLPKEEFKKWLTNKKACRVWVAHETGDKTNPYPHSHVLVEFTEDINITSSRWWDFKGIHPNVKKIKTKKHWDNSIVYMCKEDKSNEDLLKAAESLGSTVAEWIWGCTSLSEALCLAKSAAEVMGIKMLYENKPNGDEWKTDYVLQHEWQLKLINYLKNCKPNGRAMLWYYDKTGGAGKSRMAEFLEDHHDAILLTQFGGARDTATVMQNILKMGWKGNIIVVDLPRDAQDKAIYEPLESLLNGRITAIKYSGGTLKWPHPHVVVFANFMPDPARLSKGRIDVINITNHNPVGPPPADLDYLDFIASMGECHMKEYTSNFCFE